MTRRLAILAVAALTLATTGCTEDWVSLLNWSTADGNSDGQPDATGFSSGRTDSNADGVPDGVITVDNVTFIGSGGTAWDAAQVWNAAAGRILFWPVAPGTGQVHFATAPSGLYNDLTGGRVPAKVGCSPNTLVGPYAYCFVSYDPIGFPGTDWVSVMRHELGHTLGFNDITNYLVAPQWQRCDDPNAAHYMPSGSLLSYCNNPNTWTQADVKGLQLAGYRS